MNPSVIVIPVLVVIAIFFLVKWAKKRSAEKEREFTKHRKMREIPRLQKAMEEASRENLAEAARILLNAGIWVQEFGNAVEIVLPEFFWEVPGPELLAKTLITLIKSSDVEIHNKIYHDLLMYFHGTDRESSNKVLTILLSSDIGRSFTVYIIAYAIFRSK